MTVMRSPGWWGPPARSSAAARLGGPADDGGDGLRPQRARVCETLLVRFGLLRMKGDDVA